MTLLKFFMTFNYLRERDERVTLNQLSHSFLIRSLLPSYFFQGISAFISVANCSGTFPFRAVFFFVGVRNLLHRWFIQLSFGDGW